MIKSCNIIDQSRATLSLQLEYVAVKREHPFALKTSLDLFRHEKMVLPA
jgi:hypothetical protein